MAVGYIYCCDFFFHMYCIHRELECLSCTKEIKMRAKRMCFERRGDTKSNISLCQEFSKEWIVD